ncbi:MAG: hypothetical protein ABMA13_07525 [Chthoniobacteraceae bacterium]
MKPRPSLLSRFVALFRRRRASKPEMLAPPRPAREPKARTIEPLEGRIAPATLIDAGTISFNDLDGDVVTVHFSKSFLTAGNVGDIFKFSDGTQASAFGANGPQQLQLIDLNRVPVNLATFISKAEGTSLSVTAAKGAGNIGDDFTNVGHVKATNLALGRVEIDGDLGQIDCGRSGAKVGLQALVVNSLYQFGSGTQVSGGTATEKLESRIAGELTLLDVKADLHGFIHVIDGIGLSATAAAKIGSVKVAGSLRGNISDNTGTIESARGIGAVNVGGLVGGGGKNSGSIVAGTGISSLTAGSLMGGIGVNSGAIVAGGGLPLVKITGDVTGGGGIGSGSIHGAVLGKATIGGMLTGAGGAESGSVQISKTIASLTISGDVMGAGGAGSGGIEFGSVFPFTTLPGSLPATTITLGGKLTGGSGFASGAIHGETALAIVKVAGDVTGGIGDRSGAIISDGTASVISVGKLVGGPGANSGSIFSGADPLLKGNLGTVTIANGMLGGTGISSGSIVASKIGSVRVGSALQNANVTGGGGDFSGSLISTSTIRSVQIFGSVAGDDGGHSGAIESSGNITKVAITGNLTGGDGDFSGSVRAQELIDDDFIGTAASISTLSVGVIDGGSGVNSGRVEAAANLGPLTAASLKSGGAIVAGAGFLGAGSAGSIKVSGEVESIVSVRGKLGAFVAGSLDGATVRAGRDIAVATINGDVANSTISAAGQAIVDPLLGDLAIAKLTIKGDVSGSRILAGYDLSGVAMNADASIGTVLVTGDWTASDIVAGVMDVSGDGFGDADDTKIAGGVDRTGFISKIASIVVNGPVAGTPGGADQFGFTAQRILAFKSGGLATVLTPGTGNDDRLVGTTGDVRIHEVAL